MKIWNMYQPKEIHRWSISRRLSLVAKEEKTTDYFGVGLRSSQLKLKSWPNRDEHPRMQLFFVNSARLLQQWTVSIQVREHLAGLLNANLNRTLVSNNLLLIDTDTELVKEISYCTERIAMKQNNTLVSNERT